MSTSTTAIERYQPVLNEVEQSTLLGFLAGYRGFTRDAYALDLRQFTAWWWQHDRRLFDVHGWTSSASDLRSVHQRRDRWPGQRAEPAAA